MFSPRRLVRLAVRRVRSNAPSAVSAGLVLLLAVTGVVYAAGAQEFPISDVQLHDAGVWLTNRSDSIVSRFNTESNSFENAVLMTSDDPNFDVLQDGSEVLLVDPGSHTIRTVDPVRGKIGAELAVPPKAVVRLGGPSVAVYDPATGKAWIKPFSQITGLNTKGPPDISAKPGSSLAVGIDGTVYLADPATGRLWTVRPGGTPHSVSVDRLAGAADVAVSAVGMTPVLMSAAARLLWRGTDSPRDIPDLGQHVIVQQAGEAADHLISASDNGLWSIPLNGGDPIKLAPGGGGAVAPVQVAGCVFAAWTQSMTRTRVCGDTPVAAVQPIVGGSTGDPLVFRVNRDRVVLNNLRNGTGVRPDDQLIHETDWTAVNQRAKAERKLRNSDDDTTDVNKTQRRRRKNVPPDAKDDHYGARPASAVVIRALENDTDPNGDVLVIDGFKGLAEDEGRAAVIADGQAIQFVPKSAGTVSFTYRISDASGQTDDATITVDVKGDSDEEAPKVRAVAKRTTTVETGKSVRYDALADWVDPDGDPLYLAKVGPVVGGRVQYTSAGMITYVDGGSNSGKQQIDVTVSDGQKSESSTLAVSVLPAKAQPPIAHDDVATGLVGETLALAPLDNDSDPNGDPLRLAKVPTLDGLHIETDPTQTRLSITATKPGTYPFKYQVSDGGRTATAQVRVTFATPKESSPPVAVDDMLFVPISGFGEVDLLANDVDVDGDVLVVQQVEQSDDQDVKIALVEHRLLRVWARTKVSRPIRLGYQVSDGDSSSSGMVLIRSTESSEANQPPTPADDSVTVRTGDVATVPVLDNDTDPDGDRLSLDPAVTESGLPGGVLFTSGNLLRFQAPAQAGTVTAVYSAVDPNGDKASAQVQFTVRAPSSSVDNEPPVPDPATARVFAGTTARIPVDLSGIDPDGDSSTIDGVVDPPKLGYVDRIEGGDTLVYNANQNASGTESFRYQVRDARGAVGSATVRIGVAPRTTGNQPPTAVDDSFQIRPGRTLSAAVINNDTDPDDDYLKLDQDQPLGVVGPGTARVIDGRVLVTSNGTAGRINVTYAIDDGRGGHDTANVDVTVAPDAPLLPPLAYDDVTDAGTEPRPAIDVRANDDDPDGQYSTLRVALIGPSVGVASVGADQRVTVQRAQQAVAVAYQITDMDQQSSRAFVWAPGLQNQPPRLKPNVAPLQVPADGSATFRLADFVTDPEGQPLRLSDGDDHDPQSADGDVEVKGLNELTFRPVEGFVGSTSVSLRVVDEPGAGQSPQRATIVVPVEVVTSQPNPKLLDTELTVRRGGKPVVVDLSSFVMENGAPLDERYTFTLGTHRDGTVNASLSGSVLRVQATQGSEAAGTARIELPVTVRNRAGRSDSGSVIIRVVSVPKPLPVVHDIRVNGRAGTPIKINWADAVTAPPGAKITLVGSASVSPTGKATARVEGQTLTVVPAPGWTGPVKMFYAVTDAPGDDRRTVKGTAQITFQDLPGVPGTPALLKQANGAITLAWAPAVSNGSPITEYRVTVAGARTQSFGSTTGTFNGLQNGTAYRFSVVAVNAVGVGGASALSAPITPDDRPDTPAAPVASFVPGGSGGRLNVSWTAVEGRGITYEVKASPGGPTITSSGTSASFTGLTNGKSYTFSVRAKSATGVLSAFSPPSAPQIPAGVPSIPEAPKVTQESATSARVNWAAAEGNGAAISHYYVQVGGGGLIDAGTATQTSVTLEVGKTYTFSVKAKNKSGESAFGPLGTGKLEPVPVMGPVSAEPKDQAALLSFSAPSGNIDSYEVSVNGGAFKPLSGKTVSGLTNGKSYSFNVKACTKVACGDPSLKTNTVVPFGSPGKPTNLDVSGADLDHPKLAWCAPEPNGRPVTTQYRINSGSWNDEGSGCQSTQIKLTDYGTAELQVRAVDSSGQAGEAANISYALKSPNFELISVCCRNDIGSNGDFTMEFDLRFGGDYPDGIRDLTWWFKPVGGECQVFDRLNPSGSAGQFSDKTFHVTVHGKQGGDLCGWKAVNAWNGAPLKISFWNWF